MTPPFQTPAQPPFQTAYQPPAQPGAPYPASSSYPYPASPTPTPYQQTSPYLQSPAYQAAPYPAASPYTAPAQTAAFAAAATQEQAERARHRWLRKTTDNSTGLLLVYQVVFTAVNIIASFAIARLIAQFVYGGHVSKAQLSADMVGWTGVLMLITVIGGMCFILPMRRKLVFRREFWAGESDHARMRPSWLIVFIVLVISIQVANILISSAIAGLGMPLPSPTSDSINEASTNIGMWLYVGLVAPVCEELVFRGVLMRGLKPIGKNFAIFTSALMFGLFHDDVVQGTFAFCLGLLLGFVAMEYSLIWSIVLHAFNNAVLGLLMPWLMGLAGETGTAIYGLSLLGIGIIGIIVVIVKYGRGLLEYRRANRSPRGTYWAWTSPTFLVFVGVNLAFALYSFITALMV